MKKLLSLIAVLCLLASAAVAESTDELILSATVEPAVELALKAPASGELAPFTVKAGDRVSANETLFKVEPKRVYAEISGTVADVYARQGESADAAMTRYGAVMRLEYADRYTLSCVNLSGTNHEANRDLFVGAPVYLRSANENHHADGVITAVDGDHFTVAVRGGDLNYTETVKVYREPDYRNSSLLARENLISIAPYAVSASGTVVETAVARGDAVQPGDFLFAYVPDVLEPVQRSKADPTAVSPDQAAIVLSVAASHGASVQKGQLLATICPVGSYRLMAQAEEGDLRDLHVGQTLTVRFEESGAPDTEAVISSIGALGSGGDISRYAVYLEFVADAAVLPGMHTTVELKR